MFLSNKSLTYDRTSFVVDSMSSASCLLGEFLSSFTSELEKLAIHFKGVISSWVILDVKRWSNLLEASILYSFFTSVTSLIVRTLHS